jgi:hypothetical protein
MRDKTRGYYLLENCHQRYRAEGKKKDNLCEDLFLVESFYQDERGRKV